MSILLNNKQITDLRKIRPIIRDQNNNRNLSKRQGTSNLNTSSNADEISNEDCSNIPDSTNHHNGQSVIPKLIFAENKIPKLKKFSNVSNICINDSLSKANTYLNTINEKLSKQSDLNFHIQKEELRFQTHQPIISPGAINVNVNVNNINIPHLHFGMQLIFDESQVDSPNEIWIDVYHIVEFLKKNRSAVCIGNSETKDYVRKYDFMEDTSE